MKILKYTDNRREEWNLFNKNSKQPLFMFDRGFMEYHKDRFIDHSLMFYNDKNELIAILPMSEHDDEVVSHGGLTYGGFITDSSMRQDIMLDCFRNLIEYLKYRKFKKMTYKIIPHIYHMQPSEEDRYGLFISNAELKKIEASTVINLSNPLRISRGRKGHISRAKREGVEVKELNGKEDFMRFISVQNTVLRKYHNTTAVHSGEELAMLYNLFPNNIRLFVGVFEGDLIAGTLIFEYENVVHTQYLAANETARQIGALDYVISEVINRYKDSKKWLDFGISTENNGLYLNNGLISQKEGFGGRTITYETWVIDIRSKYKL